jgi:hypothetical protein
VSTSSSQLKEDVSGRFEKLEKRLDEQKQLLTQLLEATQQRVQ